MSRMCFVFGEGESFFYDGPLSWEKLNMPRGIEDAFTGLHTVIDLYRLALGSRGAYYMSFIRNDGNVKYVDDVVHAKLPLNLLTFLSPTTKDHYSPLLEATIKIPSIAHSIPDIEVWLGANDSYFVQNVRTSRWQHDGLPSALVDAMKMYNTNSTRTNPIRLLTLGYGGSYFAAWNNGSFAYDLVGCSRTFDGMLDRLLDVDGRGDENVSVGDIEYISISPFQPNHWILFFKDGTYFCFLPPTWHVLCAPISGTNAAFLKKQYPDAKPLPNSTRREIVSQLIQTVTEQTLTTICTSSSTNTTATVDSGAGSSAYAPDTGSPESMFYSNVIDTGGLAFGMGESVVAAHGLAGVTDAGVSASSSNDLDGGSGVAHFSSGGDGGGGAVIYPGGDGGGGGGGAIGGFGF